MCGILLSNFKQTSELFKCALSTMSNRGPDHTAIFDSDHLKIGHTRLKIQDITDDAANQPFCYNDYVCVFNGEVYNFKELAKTHKLELTTNSDTEVVLLMFEKYGSDCLQYFIGMFAFAIYSKSKRNVFIARDRLGVKPLYFTHSSDNFIVGSEIKSILTLTNDYELDPVGLRQYKKLRTFFKGHTVYKGIRSFPAASYAYIDIEHPNFKFQKYWSPEFTCDEAISDELVEDLVNSSISYRCVSDVPYSSFLSGGLDSSIIAKIAPITEAWSAGFSDDNEFSYAELVSNPNIHLHKVTLAYSEFRTIQYEMIRKRAAPLSVPNEVLLYKMSLDASKKYKVMLCGEGADELFCGYSRIYTWANNCKWNLAEFDSLYSYSDTPDDEIIEYVMEDYSTYKSNFQKITAFMQLSHLQGLLSRLDYSTMLASIEAREPFVDHRLVELMARGSYAYKTDSGTTFKAPLKRIFGKYLPSEILQRNKVGFAVPLAKIYTSNARKKSTDWLDDNLELFLKEIAHA